MPRVTQQLFVVLQHWLGGRGENRGKKTENLGVAQQFCKWLSERLASLTPVYKKSDEGNDTQFCLQSVIDRKLI